MLKIDNLLSGYGKLQVLNGVSIEAKPDEVTVIVGPNGSGKSTLLKSISGLTTIFGGTIMIDGSKNITGLHPYAIARMGVAYLPQTENVFTNLTVQENITLAGYTLDREDLDKRISETLELFPQLKRYLTTKATNLSGGERQMLAMMMALLRKPTVMMFDEPTANLAPKIATQVLTTISSLAETMHVTLLLVEQNAKRALEIGDQAYLLVSGKKNFEGHPKDLLEHKEIGRLYLGLRADVSNTSETAS